MKKTAILTVLLAFVLFSFGVYAEDEKIEEEIAVRSGADKIYESEYISNDEKKSGNIDVASKVFSVIGQAFEGFFKTGIKFFCTLLGVLVLSAVMTAFGRTSDSASIKTVYDYITVLTLSAVMFSGLQSVFLFASESVDRLCIYMSALLPVTASLYTLGGNVSTGVAGSSSLLLFLTVIERFSGVMLMPLLRAGFIAAVAGSLPGSVDLRSVSNFLKNTLTTLMAFVFTVFGVVMYFQTVITASADSYVFRTVKFASGVFIPVIGNIVGEAARTVTSAVCTVKASVGAIGIISIAALTLPAVIYVIMYKLFTLAGAMVARMLSLERESAMLYDISGFLSVLMSLLIGTGVIFVIAVALFIRIGAEA